MRLIRRRAVRPPRLRRRRFASLTARLVVTAVTLVAVVTLLVGGATAFAMHAYLTHRLDQDVAAALDRAEHGPDGDGDYRGPGYSGAGSGYPQSGDLGDVQGQSVGTVTARFYYSDTEGLGNVIHEQGDGMTERSKLGKTTLQALAAVPVDGEVHHLDVPGLGSIRVAAGDSGGNHVVTGLPDAQVDDAVSTLVLWEALLIVAGLAAATAVGLSVVRRQLRPLREVALTAHTVAELPLDAGEIGVTSRVPAHLTDEQTEVGRVGSALNTLLAHVEISLDARHRSEQRVRQFVADASHELRTPLTTIAGYAELARRRPDDVEASATALAKVSDESARMTALVEDLLLLARLDSGRPLEQSPVDLTRLLLEAVADARVLAPDHHWRLDLPEEVVEVVGDEQRLHQVATNLLTNARKYTPAGTTVTVAARAGGFTVHDDGPGFPDGLVDHAFERFARGDAARHREGGVGLGLALVQAIVAAHGGTVTLTSTPGDTTVAVRLGGLEIV